jgi:AcrR family transcriptional regulator
MTKPLRADAERNRLRILAAADALFAERGLDASLDEVALAAGVGVGTVYRRFASKDALIDALFEDKIRQVESLARAALEIADPWQAFVWFMYEVCRLHASDRGLKDAMLSDARGHERVRRARDTIGPVGEALLVRAQAAGAVRADLVITDVPIVHFAVGLIAERTRDVSPEFWQRLLALMLDGLVAARDDATPLPVGPLGPEEFASAMSRRRRG